MTKTSTALTFRHITAKALERAKLTTAYALLERDLFRAHGRTAVRHLTDNERRQLARMGHDLGWRRLRPVAAIATVRTIRRWFRDLIDQPGKAKRPGGMNLEKTVRGVKCQVLHQALVRMARVIHLVG